MCWSMVQVKGGVVLGLECIPCIPTIEVEEGETGPTISGNMEQVISVSVRKGIGLHATTIFTLSSAAVMGNLGASEPGPCQALVASLRRSATAKSYSESAAGVVIWGGFLIPWFQTDGQSTFHTEDRDLAEVRD